jgi:hypothetical protein
MVVSPAAGLSPSASSPFQPTAAPEGRSWRNQLRIRHPKEQPLPALPVPTSGTPVLLPSSSHPPQVPTLLSNSSSCSFFMLAISSLSEFCGYRGEMREWTLKGTCPGEPWKNGIGTNEELQGWEDCGARDRSGERSHGSPGIAWLV